MADRKRREAEARAAKFLDNSKDGIAYIQDGMSLYVNQSFADHLKYDDTDEVCCVPVIDLVAEEDQDRIRHLLQKFATKSEDGEDSAMFNVVFLCSDNSKVSIELEGSHSLYEEEPCFQLRIPHNAPSTELQQRIDEIKDRDAGTGLRNRAFMIRSLESLISSNSPHGYAMMIEIDQFYDYIQPKIGLAACDEAVTKIAQIINKCCQQEKFLLSRFSEDSLMLLVSNASIKKAKELCQAILYAANANIIEVDSQTIQFTVSIGLTFSNENSSSGDEVINQTQKAIAAIRSNDDPKLNHNQYLIYEASQTDNQSSSAVSVQNAIDEGHFRLLYQPVISLRGSGEEYYEVTLRMLDNAETEIPPSQFLETVKSIGLGAKLDRWVILESMKSLSQKRLKHPKTKLLINIGKDSIKDKGLCAWVKKVLQAAKFDGGCVVFQINEADANHNLTDTQEFLQQLQALKIQTLLSNFGCALNPMNSLEHLNFDFIKIDGSFSLDIQNHAQSTGTLLELLNQLHEREKVTVVPLVENASILSSLWQAGVHYIQGQYLQSPNSAMEYDFNMEED
jgi:diguanylate cyclase (GGDEF)-like protein